MARPDIDLVLTHGKIATMAPAGAFTEALAVAGGKIVAVGRSDEMEALAGPDTRRIDAEGPRPLLELLNELDGFRLQLADWKGEWICGQLEVEQLEEFLRYYEPGEHLLAVQQRTPVTEATREALLTPGLPAHLVAELARLLPISRYACWSPESDHLFG